MKTGEAKFASVDLRQFELMKSPIEREITLAKIVIKIHGDKYEVLSSLKLDEIVLSNPQGYRIPVVYQPIAPTTKDYHFSLPQNYPNPFNPETWIPYHLAVASQVEISIYESTGRKVRQLTVGWQVAGGYQGKDRAAYWDGKNKLGEPVASGIYFYTIHAGEFKDTRKMLMMK